MTTHAQDLKGVLEIRTYQLKKGSAEVFDRAVKERAMPLLKKADFNIVNFGHSLQGEDVYYLVRQYESLDDLNKRENEFYTSDAWVNGPRAEILSHIDSYTNLIINGNALHAFLPATSVDKQKLQELNAKFIENFIKQDTAAHAEIIHRDFICIESSGAVVGREEYLKEWATAYSQGNFKSFSYSDESISIFGNTALVRSTTNYVKMVDGREVKGHSVYTDTYIRENGRWWCIQAQITPVK